MSGSPRRRRRGSWPRWPACALASDSRKASAPGRQRHRRRPDPGPAHVAGRHQPHAARRLRDRTPGDRDARATTCPGSMPGSSRSLRTRLDALPAGMNTAMATETEETFFLDWFIRKAKGAKDKETLVTAVRLHQPGTGGETPRLREQGPRIHRGMWGHPGGRAPSRGGDAGELQADRRDAGPAAGSIREGSSRAKGRSNPPTRSTRSSSRRSSTCVAPRRGSRNAALLMTALAVQLDGRDALKDHPDPIVGGTFEYVPIPDGFELRSKFQARDNKPVTLTVGRQKNP